MDIISLIFSLFIFSIIVMFFTLVLWLRTREINNKELVRFIGAIICFSSTGILLIMKETVKTTFNYGIAQLNNIIGISLNQLVIGFIIFIIVLVFLKVLKR